MPGIGFDFLNHQPMHIRNIFGNFHFQEDMSDLSEESEQPNLLFFCHPREGGDLDWVNFSENKIRILAFAGMTNFD